MSSSVTAVMRSTLADGNGHLPSLAVPPNFGIFPSRPTDGATNAVSIPWSISVKSVTRPIEFSPLRLSLLLLSSLSISFSLCDPIPETRNPSSKFMSDRDPIKEEEEKEEKAVSSPPAAPGSGPPPVSSPPTDRGAVALSETLGQANSATVVAGDGRSFSQLLAGAMASPAGSPRVAPILAVPVETVHLPLVAVPCFLAPASLLESQGFTGQFAMTHQAVLATVTAQAQMHLQASYPPSSEASASPFPQPMLTSVNLAPLQQRPPQTPESEQPPSSNQKAQNTQIVVKPISSDGYNWRKYGQKQVKSGDRSRSYYKCTDVNCSAKKKIERCPDGRETEIIYRGQHNHDPPRKTRCTKEKGIQPSGPGGPSGESEMLDLPSSEVNESDPPAPKAEQNSINGTSERQLYCSSDCEGDAAIKTEEEHVDEPDAKRRITESTTPYTAPVLKMIKEPKVVVQNASDAATVGDGYRWRKYGQKIVKGNPNPRSYYRCTHTGCPVRKHVERASDDTKAIVITYEGKHNHDQPPTKSSSDQPPTALLVAAAAVAEVNKDEELHSSNSSDEKLPKDEAAAAAGDKALELGGEKALESAQTLLSIGFNSSAEKEANGNNSDGMNQSLFSEKKCSAVPVHNS